MQRNINYSEIDQDAGQGTMPLPRILLLSAQQYGISKTGSASSSPRPSLIVRCPIVRRSTTRQRTCSEGAAAARHSHVRAPVLGVGLEGALQQPRPQTSLSAHLTTGCTTAQVHMWAASPHTAEHYSPHLTLCLLSRHPNKTQHNRHTSTASASMSSHPLFTSGAHGRTSGICSPTT